MRDGNGAVLASEIFGFRGEEPRWWEVPQLALSSPIVHACRVEAEPFWCNAHGFFTRLPNPLLDVIDLHDFRIRAMTAAAIVVPIHLPFGQIGAASFLSPEPEANDLSDAYACAADALAVLRSEEHTSELQSLMRSSYAFFCFKQINITNKPRLGPIY